MSTNEPKPWLDEDIDERIDELKREGRWTLPRGHDGVVPCEGGHLVVLHASVLLDMLATIERLRSQ